MAAEIKAILCLLKFAKPTIAVPMERIVGCRDDSRRSEKKLTLGYRYLPQSHRGWAQLHGIGVVACVAKKNGRLRSAGGHQGQSAHAAAGHASGQGLQHAAGKEVSASRDVGPASASRVVRGVRREDPRAALPQIETQSCRKWRNSTRLCQIDNFPPLPPEY